MGTNSTRPGLGGVLGRILGKVDQEGKGLPCELVALCDMGPVTVRGFFALDDDWNATNGRYGCCAFLNLYLSVSRTAQE
jgi:hypothetical protein